MPSSAPLSAGVVARCPSCGSALPAAAAWCPRCLQPLDPALTGDAGAAPGIGTAARSEAPFVAPTPAVRVSGWPRKLLLFAAIGLTLAIGSTLLPHHGSSSPAVVGAYSDQLASTVAAVQAATPALRAVVPGTDITHAPAARDAVAAAAPAFPACTSALASMGVPAGMEKAHHELQQACAGYQTATTAALGWQANANAATLVRVRVGVRIADQAWNDALARIARAGGRLPSAPGGGPEDGPGGLGGAGGSQGGNL